MYLLKVDCGDYYEIVCASQNLITLERFKKAVYEYDIRTFKQRDKMEDSFDFMNDAIKLHPLYKYIDSVHFDYYHEWENPFELFIDEVIMIDDGWDGND